MSIYTTSYQCPAARSEKVILECRGGKQPGSGYLWARHEVDVDMGFDQNASSAGEQFRLDCIYP